MTEPRQFLVIPVDKHGHMQFGRARVVAPYGGLPQTAAQSLPGASVVVACWTFAADEGSVPSLRPVG
jgi:hypothetical protein